LREVALQNVSMSDDAIEEISPRLSMELAELVVINQVRLLRRTTLLEAIESNPNLNNDQRRRLRELRESFHIGEQPEASPSPGSPELVTMEEEPEAPPLEEVTFTSEAEAMSRYLSEEERQHDE